MANRLFILCTSHMDREWYLPLGGNRVLFLKLFDRVFELLERFPKFRFYTDGQTSVLEDYLEARPDLSDTAAAYVSQGRLIPGPWFVLSDERIPTGESLVRNLLIGCKYCSILGGSMKCGYVPDSFGHISQLPQILNQFSIDTAFMMRGPDISRTGREFVWTGKNNSKVTCIATEYGKTSVCDWNGMLWNGIHSVHTKAELDECLQYVLNEKNTVLPYDLLIVGGDGQTPPKDLDLLGIEENDSLDDVFEYIKPYGNSLKTITGELSQSEDVKTLQDTLSSRIYLKTLNASVQTELMRFAEPLTVISAPLDKSRTGVLHLAWKSFVECHTHDGITGCHCDRTANEIENRLERVSAISQRLTDLAMEELAEKTNTSFTKEHALCVFHPGAHVSSLTVPFTVQISAKTAEESIRIMDTNGNEVPIVVTARDTIGTIRSNNDAQQMFRKVVRFTGLAFCSDLPSMGMKAYEVIGTPSAPAYCLLHTDNNTITTPYLCLEIVGSGIRLTDKRNGTVYNELNLIRDQSNIGDCYTIIPEGQRYSIPCKGHLAYNNGAFAAFEFTGENVKWVCEVNAFDPLVRISLSIDNRNDDHAVYASFKTDGGIPFRDQPFALEEGLYGVQPSSTFAGFEKEGRGLAVLHKGIHRAEFSENGTLTLALLSCQGRLYRSFFPDSRNEDFSGCEVHQIIKHSYALLPLNGNEDIFTIAQDYTDGVSCFDTLPHNGPRSDTWSYLKVSGAIQTSVKVSENGKLVLVRIFNPNKSAETVTLTPPFGIKSVGKYTLSEDLIEVIDPSSFQLQSGEISTIGFELSESI